MAVGLEDFERGATALRELEKASVCRVVFVPPYGPQILQFVVVHDDPQTKQILEANSLDKNGLERVTNEVAAALSAVIRGAGPGQLARRRGTREAVVSLEPGEASEDDERKYRIAEQTFDLPRLRARAWIKQTAKGLLPLNIEWEVSEKLVDDSEARPADDPVRYGNLRIIGSPSLPLLSLFAGTHDMTMTVDREDVVTMLDSLTRLRDALDEEPSQ